MAKGVVRPPPKAQKKKKKKNEKWVLAFWGWPDHPQGPGGGPATPKGRIHVSFQSFLAEKTFMPLYGDYAVGDPPLGFPENSTSTMTTPTSFPFTFFSEDFPALKYRNQLGQNSSDEGPRVGQLKSGEDAGKHKLNLKLPKTEPFHFHNEFNTETIQAQTQTQPFDFLTNPTADLKLSQHFFHLPHLHSLELEHSQAQAYLSASPSKRARVESVTSDPQTLDSIVQSCYYLNPHFWPRGWLFFFFFNIFLFLFFFFFFYKKNNDKMAKTTSF
jgi:hypothetical protein